MEQKRLRTTDLDIPFLWFQNSKKVILHYVANSGSKKVLKMTNCYKDRRLRKKSCRRIHNYYNSSAQNKSQDSQSLDVQIVN